MAKKRFRIKDAQGNVVPYDVAAEDVTLSDGRSVETGKASVLNNAGFLDPAHFPKLMLYNVTPFTSEPDYSAIPVGSIYLDEREDAPYKRLFYKKNIDGNTQTIDLGAPQDGVVYCHQSTGILYRWVPTSYGRDGSFQQVGGDADLRDDSNHVKQSLATPVVLRNVSAAMLDDLAVGDVYFGEGHLYCHASSSNDADLGAPSKKLIYYCLADSKCYRWTGSSFTAISITPHIDTTTGNWFIGSYNTGVHAQGPKGNSVVDGDTFNVINNLTEGGEEDALSAEMGKTLRAAILTIYNALGAYAFSEGKPSLNWNSGVIKHSITATLTGVKVSAISVNGNSVNSLPSDIVDNQSLTLTLTPTNSGEVINESTLVITMGGINYTSAYNSSTGVIVISASAVAPYISLGYSKPANLVFMLDGILQGSNSNAWTDLVNGVVFANHGATKLANGWQFDGTNYLSSENMQSHEPQTCTIEVCFESGLTRQGYHIFTDGSRMVFNYTSNYQNTDLWIVRGFQLSGADYGGITMGTGGDNGYGKRIVSIKGNEGGLVNGVHKNAIAINYGAGAKAMVGGMWGATSNALGLPFTGKVYAIRIYNTILTDAEILANHRIDNQRFELGLTIN